MTIKHNLLFFFSVSFFLFTQNICMEENQQNSLHTMPFESVNKIIKFLDYKSKIAFIKTCYEFYTYYNTNKIFLFNGLNNNLSNINYIKLLNEYRNDKKLWPLLIKGETENNRNLRTEIEGFFDEHGSPKLPGSGLTNILQGFGSLYFTNIETAIELPTSLPYLMCTKGSNLNDKDNHGWTLLHRAVNSPGDYTRIKNLLKIDPLLLKRNTTNNMGSTALMIAIQNNDKKSLKLLLKDPYVNVNKQDKKTGYTALHLAASQEANIITIEMVKLLLGSPNIDPFIKDEDDYQAEHYVNNRPIKNLFIEYKKKQSK